MAKQKLDGRRVVPGSVFPFRYTHAAKARIIAMFEAEGKSFHSPKGHTVGVILDHCLRNDIHFTLCRGFDGSFSIEKIELVAGKERVCTFH